MIKKGPTPQSTADSELAKALQQLQIADQTKKVDAHCENVALQIYHEFRDLNFHKTFYSEVYKKYKAEFKTLVMTRKIMAQYFRIVEEDQFACNILITNKVGESKSALSALNGKIHYVAFMIEKISIMNPQYEFFRFGVFPKYFEHLAKGMCMISNALGSNIIAADEVSAFVALAKEYHRLAEQYGNQYLESLRASLHNDTEKLKKYPSIQYYKKAQWEGYTEYFCVYYYFALILSLCGEREMSKENAERAYQVAKEMLDNSSAFSKFETAKDMEAEFKAEVQPFVNTIKSILAHPDPELELLLKLKQFLATFKANNQRPQMQHPNIAHELVLAASNKMTQLTAELPSRFESRNKDFVFVRMAGLMNHLIMVKMSPKEINSFYEYLALFDHINDCHSIEERSQYLDALSTLTQHWISMLQIIDSHVALKFVAVNLHQVKAEIEKAKASKYVLLQNRKEEVTLEETTAKAVSWRKQAKRELREKQKTPQPRIIQTEAHLDTLMSKHQATMKVGLVVKKRKKQKKTKVTAGEFKRYFVSHHADVEVFVPEVVTSEVAITHEVIAKRVQVRHAQIRKVDILGTIYEDASAYRTAKTIKIDPTIKRFMETLIADGFQSYVYGGAVRDQLLGLVPNDWDLRMQYSSEDQIAQLRKQLYLVARSLSLHIKEIEGREGYFKIGKNIDFNLTQSDMKTEAFRKDFTINSFFADHDGYVYAPMGNISEIDLPVLMAIGDFEQRI